MVSRIKKSTSFFKLALKSIGTTISQTSLLSNLTMLTSFLLIKTLNITKLSLIPLDGLVSLSISLVGMIKGNFKFVDVRLKLLLDAKSLSLGTRLCLQRSLQGVHSAHVVFAGVVKLLLLLLDLAINFLANLSKFQLSPQDLVLLLLKSSLSFFKSSLELFLLNLKTTPLFVKLMDRAASISKLVKKILVLPLNNIKLLSCFIPSCLQAEQLAVVVAAFLLAGINLSSKIINLGLPFSNDLVKVSASLLSNDSSGVDSFIFKLNILKLSLKTMFGLLSACNLLVQGLNGLLSFNEPGRKFLLAAFKLINAAESFSFKLRPPQLDFSLRFGQCLEGIRLLLRLLLNPLPQILELTVQILELG